MQITTLRWIDGDERTKLQAVAAIMQNVDTLAHDTAVHSGESTGNLANMRRRIEDQVRVLVGLDPLQPELPGLPPL